ncbi:MAG TPA: hypothetical protein VGK78_10395 [Nocardioides sp.]|uniref:hypothetical protein n=1 Tax=Nocardioides sp. TaxID=35761 RepID=UPI002F40212F
MSAMPNARVVATLAAFPLLIGPLTGCGSDARGATDASRNSSEKVQTNGAAQAGVETVPIGTPCPGAIHGDPMKIAAASDAPVYLPRTGTHHITEAWRCGDTPVFVFDDVQLSFESGWANVEIPEKFQDLANDYGGSVEPVQGLSAWVAPSSPNDEVLMVKDGNAIRLLAKGSVPIEHLVTLAEDLDLANPVNR